MKEERKIEAQIPTREVNRNLFEGEINPEFSAKIEEFFIQNIENLSKISKKNTELWHSRHFELKKFFVPSFKILLSCKSPQHIPERLLTKIEYYPKSSETIIGSNVSSQNKKPEILLQIKKKVQLILLQDKKSVKIYEKFNEPRPLKPLSRFEIQDELIVQIGDLFRIGKTIIEIKDIGQNVIFVNYINKTSKGENLNFSSDFTIGNGKNNDINIKDFLACNCHATIAYQGYWVIKNKQRLNTI